jgi:predicted transposase/invertase (TIGR01784 family)
MLRFADPRNDFAFKKIFGSEHHTGVLMSFLNAVLPIDIPIVSINLANPYQAPSISELKQTILDVTATDANGRNFIVEMQVEPDRSFSKRAEYYAAKKYSDQLNAGEHYKTLCAVYFVGILDYIAFTDPKVECVSHHRTQEILTGKQYLDSLNYTFIELPKFTIPIDGINQLKTITDKWLYFIRYAPNLHIIPEPLANEPIIQEALDIAEQSHWTLGEKDTYDYRLKEIQKAESELETAELKGEMKKAIKTAHKLYDMGLTVAQIMQATDLTTDQLAKIGIHG